MPWALATNPLLSIQSSEVSLSLLLMREQRLKGMKLCSRSEQLQATLLFTSESIPFQVCKAPTHVMSSWQV